MSSFTKLCRLCLKKCRPNDNYEDLGHDYSIRCKVAIQEIFNIIVSFTRLFGCFSWLKFIFCLFQNGNTTFPSKVCIDCSQKVLLFYDYFVVVQKNQEILLNGINGSSGDILQNARPITSFLNPLSKRNHYTSIPSANLFEIGGTSGAAEMDIDNSIDTFRNADVETKPEVFSTPKPFLTFEERKAIEEKIKMIKDNMTDDEKIKIFYGLQCTTCNTSVEFNKLVEYEEHCLKQHDVVVTSFMCCKTKIKREFLIDHIEYHLGTPAVRVLRSRNQTMGPSSVYNNLETNNGSVSLNNGTTSVEGDERSSATESGPYKFPCSRCERSYMVKSSLKRHMTISHGYTCDVCDKTFDDDIKLKKHQFIFHSTDGPFKCNMCGSDHETRRQLYNHKRWHTRQLNAVNPMALSLDDDENIHDLTAASDKTTNEDQNPILDDPRMFKCSLCSGSFHSNRNLKIHMSLKHKKTIVLMGKSIKKRYVSPFKQKVDLPKLRCKVCGFLSLYRQNLKRHIRLRHPESAETEEDVLALFEDTSANDQENQETVAEEDEDPVEMQDEDNELANKSTENMQVSQIKEEQEDSMNMFQCLSNSLLS